MSLRYGCRTYLRTSIHTLQRVRNLHNSPLVSLRLPIRRRFYSDSAYQAFHCAIAACLDSQRVCCLPSNVTRKLPSPTTAISRLIWFNIFLRFILFSRICSASSMYSVDILATGSVVGFGRSLTCAIPCSFAVDLPTDFGLLRKRHP